MPSSSEDQTTAFRDGMPDRAAFETTRFTPGVVIGDRYRIVSLLGSGGIGEVYRADDMKLGQRVALKYIPPKIAGDPATFARLCAEARLARQVSHPNVCRVFDIVLVEGQHFLSMEFVEGEDLRSLLQRIGRLPVEKGLAVARDICAGLAAAHDREVVHRDLKPANVMIDGRGRALIADFGLAVAANELDSANPYAGTPAYMAPEQIRGGPITARSDIYSLGLILYELFTGTRLFTGSFDEIRDAHQRPKPRPSTIVKELDPELERLILRCLEEDPLLRPSSAHAVLAALPGGNALDAAIAAGETPSPEMVAAAAAKGELDPRTAWLLFAAALASILLAVWTSAQWTLTGLVSDIKSPEALIDRAREVGREFRLPRARDEAGRFEKNHGYLAAVAARRDSSKWQKLESREPSPLHFRYRVSPAHLIAANVEGVVTRNDPAESIEGMATIVLDHRGKLRSFRSVPSERVEHSAAVQFDWSVAFAAAGLDPGSLSDAMPLWTPPYGYDSRHAWTGSYGGDGEIAIRIEAASLAGRPVFFRVIEPWTRAATLPGRAPIGHFAFGLMTFVAFIGGALIARRNHLRGRGDLRGALRLAGIVAVFRFLATMFMADHVTSFTEEWELVIRAFGFALGRGAVVGVLYLAVEPYVRRAWPRMLIGWNRLLIRGHFGDPLVGRDLMIGAVAGGLTVAISRASVPLGAALGLQSAIPLNPLSFDGMRSPAGYLATIFLPVPLSVLSVLATLTLLVLVMMIVRHYAVAMLLTLAVFTLVFVTGQVPFVANFLQFAATLYVLHRFGALAYATNIAVRSVLFNTPFGLDPASWYAPRGYLTLLLLASLAAWGFRAALAGRPLFGETLPERKPAAS
jgi:hypothetical protein